MFKQIECKWRQRTCKNNHLFLDWLKKYKYCPSCGEPVIEIEKTGFDTICDNCKANVAISGGLPEYCTNCGEKG
jgi:hypothetical protein